MNQKFLKLGVKPADILLPREADMSRWAVVACDQFTSQPEYWEEVDRIAGDAPSTLRLILPESKLNDPNVEEHIANINRSMDDYLARDIFKTYGDSVIYIERKQSDGAVRHGLVAACDLEQYDYTPGSGSLIRATEGTVLERIPPRVAIRRDAPVELPHVMLLIDDPKRTVIEPTLAACTSAAPLYDFDLMLDGGHVRGYLLDASAQEAIKEALGALIAPSEMTARYGCDGLAPLLFAVGDGNHSLATAKTFYEEVKAAIGAEAAMRHPARYALTEIVNLHDEALRFEPIYRVVFGADTDALLRELRQVLSTLNGTAPAQELLCVRGDCDERIPIPHPTEQLAVGTLQTFLNEYVKRHPEVEIDYIHGEDSLRTLAKETGAIGFLFDGMRKDELFRTVIFDGALPRKTFSMGHAPDKRYYLECRKIK